MPTGRVYKCPFIARGTQHICSITNGVCDWSSTWPYYLECPHYLSKQRRIDKFWGHEQPNYEDLIIAGGEEK